MFGSFAPAFFAAWSLASIVSAQTSSIGVSRATLLDVPYLTQSEALCGGAAASMVLRYWGASDISPYDFADLVDDESRGIETDALAHAVRSHGFRAFEVRGTDQLARSHLPNGRPLVVLIDVGGGRLHYVVWLGWLGDRIVIHDPAVGPFRLFEPEEFQDAWKATNYWTLLVLPSALQVSEETSDPPQGPIPLSTDACSSMVAQGVTLAKQGDVDSAESALKSSAAACPDSASAFRELAGLRFAQSRWLDAAKLAERAVLVDPGDTHAWRTLAASRFLQDETETALAAWNELNEPRIDGIRINGLSRTRFEAIAGLVELRPRTLLTQGGLRQARRRVRSLPSAQTSRLDYRPIAGAGKADIDVAIVEHRFFPRPIELVGTAVRVASDRELALSISSPTGAGERWTGSWRFWEHRPRVAISLAIPRPSGLRGIWLVEGSWEVQTYSAVGPTSIDIGHTERVVRERRRRAALSVGDWTDTDLHWELTSGVDRWAGRGTYLSLGGGVERRLLDDRFAARLELSGWKAVAQPGEFASAAVRSSWRSSAKRGTQVWKARLALDVVARDAPRGLWPGAGVGQARAPLLRAHPLLDDGIVGGDVFGHTLLHGGVEFESATTRVGPFRFGIATFADVAKSWNALSQDGSVLHADFGLGLRVHFLGERITLRVDGAHGLRDGNRAFSFGWVLPWPSWERRTYD